MNYERRFMSDFRDMIDTCDLRDLDYEGQWYTWEHGVSVKTRVRERLDCFMASLSWTTKLSNLVVQHLVLFKSDHTPILLRLERERKKKQRA